MIVNENPGVHPGEISLQMQWAPSTVIRLIEKMEYRGYLKREHAGRTTEVYPKDTGMELNTKIKEAWANLYRQYAEVLGEQQAKYGNIELT
jgi:DNA-binding MarR family transcriptional regulator